jgi:predicted Zn finger-like uncharacterized protein
MIIQCEKCQTRFRLDDSRFTNKGVKVRCSKCKHVFTVRKEVSDADTLQSETAFADFAPPVAESQTTTAANEEWSFAAETVPPPATDASDSTVFGDITLENEPAGFSFTPLESSPFATKDDKMSESVVQNTPETAPEDISFDFGEISFADSDAVDGQDSGNKSDTPPSLDTAADAPSNFGEIDFGDEPTTTPFDVSNVIQEEMKPFPAALSAHLAEATASAEEVDKKEVDKKEQSFPSEAASNVQHELPPLSIASRRKQSPLFGVLIGAVALLVISVLGFFGYSSLSTPKETATPESGKIGVRGVSSAFVKNSSAGELLVVSGEAFNEYSKPRASLQVMVTVFDSTGKKVASKNAYSGNPLTKEQLVNLPLDKIEAAMTNPFGDSLSNMGVAPGKSIPFVVVLANIPSGAKDFSVQSAGSTVATVK